MSLTKLELSDLVSDIFTDATFGVRPETYFDLALDRLNRDRPHINVTDYTITSLDNAIPTSGTIIDLPSGFDLARDQVVAIEDLLTDGYSRNSPIYLYGDAWSLYQTASSTVKLRFNSLWDVGRIFRINWRSTYTISESSSNVPDSLARPLQLICAYYLVMNVISRMAQNKREGGDEISFTAQIAAMRELAKSFLEEYDMMVKALAPAPAGVTPVQTKVSEPCRMRY
jgi:hypothetical protein